MYLSSNNTDRDRQLLIRSDSFSPDACLPSPPWIKELIGSKKEKLVDIVNGANTVNVGNAGNAGANDVIACDQNPNHCSDCHKCCAKREPTTSELNISCVSSKSGSTSIGSNTSPTVRLCLSNASTEPFSECQSCHSCLSSESRQRDVPSHCDRQSGFDVKTQAKAVHLQSAGSRVNVPIVRSVSSSVITGRPFSGSNACLVSTCVESSDGSYHSPTLSDSSKSSNSKNNSIQTNNFEPKLDNSRLSANTSDEQIVRGLVAQRKVEFLQRQVSESSYFAHSCLICGTTLTPIPESHWNNSAKPKMIGEKNNQDNIIHQQIMDYNRANGCVKHSKLSNGVDSDGDDDTDFELQYGPGIVDRLKLKFMSISIQQQCNNKVLKRCSSLENILVSNDVLHNHRCVSRGKPGHANGLLVPLLGKNGTNCVRSIAEAGNRTNGSQLSHRLYIQHHNNKNFYNSKSSAIVPVIKRAKSMETLLMHDERDSKVGQTVIQNSTVTKKETPLSNRNELQINHKSDKLMSVCDSTNSEISANSAISQTNADMKSATHVSNGLDDEMPKPDTVKTYKRIFEPTNGRTETDTKTSVNNAINKSKNNFKKTQTNGSVSAVNVKRKPPVLRATNKSSALKSQPSVNSSPTPKSQSPLPQVIQTVPSTTPRTTTTNALTIGQNDKNNNSNDVKKSANTCNSSNTAVRKPPIAPKRASLTLKASPLASMGAANAKKITASSNSNGIPKKIIKENGNVNGNGIVDKQKDKFRTTEKLKNSDSNAKESTTTNKVNGIKELSDIASNASKPVNGQSSESANNNNNNKSKELKVIKPVANIKPFNQTNQQINGDIKSEVRPTHCHTNNDEQSDSDLGHISTNETTITAIPGKTETQNETEIDTRNSDELDLNIVNANNNNISSNKCDNDGIDSESPLISLISDSLSNTNANKERICSNGVNDENVSPNTCDKSKANESRVDEQAMHCQQTIDVLKPSLLLNNENNNSTKVASSSLWSQPTKKSNGSSSTTIVFDFRGKNVKSNLAINPLPFGVSAPKRSASNGSSFDDDDDNYTGSTEIPLPSGIIFLGENIKIGRGSLLITRNKKVSHSSISISSLFWFLFELISCFRQITVESKHFV